MLSYLVEDLHKDVLPLLEKVPAEEKESAESLVNKIFVKIRESKNAFEVNAWYGREEIIHNAVERFVEHENVHAADFGAKVKWILTKAPYFYSDD